MNLFLCASRKHHTCFLLMASIEKEKASERVCVWEREREGGGGQGRARMCRTDCSSFPFLSPHAHSPRRSRDLVAPSVGPLLQRVSTEHAQSVQTQAPLRFSELEDLNATEDIHWNTPDTHNLQPTTVFTFTHSHTSRCYFCQVLFHSLTSSLA